MAESSGREYPDRPLVGVGAVVFSSQGVLLIQRGKPPRVGSWSLPGGAQKLGETVFEAARREILEETNLDAAILSLVDVVDSITRTEDGRVQYHYTLVDVVAEALAPETLRAGGDAQDATWVPVSDIDAYSLWHETERVIRKAYEVWRDPVVRS